MTLQWISSVNFHNKSDTVFLSYIVSHAEFINSGNLDPTEYAGYFLLEDFINNQVTFQIKNYRYSWDENSSDDLKYTDLHLTFSDNFDTLYWKLLAESPFLLQEDTLLLIKNEK